MLGLLAKPNGRSNDARCRGGRCEVEPVWSGLRLGLRRGQVECLHLFALLVRQPPDKEGPALRQRASQASEIFRGQSETGLERRGAAREGPGTLIDAERFIRDCDTKRRAVGAREIR